MIIMGIGVSSIVPQEPMVPQRWKADLVFWIMANWPELAVAMVDRCRTSADMAKVLGSAACRRVETNDPGWLFEMAERWPDDLIGLGPLITPTKRLNVRWASRRRGMGVMGPMPADHGL